MFGKKDILTVRAHHIDSIWMVMQDLRKEGTPVTTDEIIERQFQYNLKNDRDYRRGPDHTGGTPDGAMRFRRGLSHATRSICEGPDDTKIIVNTKKDEVCKSCQGIRPLHCDESHPVDTVAVLDLSDFAQEHGLFGELWGNIRKDPSFQTTRGVIRQYLARTEFGSKRRLLEDL